MNRIHQIDPEQTTGKTKQLLDVVTAKLGRVPNLVRVISNSPAALEGYLSFSGALTKGVLPPKVREQLALTISEINGCDYCLSGHTVYATRAGLSPEEIAAARRAMATDGKVDAILKLARAIALQRGHVSDAEVQTARAAGITDVEMVEIIQHVALSTLTNYTNNFARTEVDFPPVKAGVIEPAPVLAA